MKNWNPFKIYKFNFGDDGMFSSCLVPRQIEVCPVCQGRLEIYCTGWDDSGIMFPDEFSLFCENMFDEEMCPINAIENRMPYVYWLPVQTKCENWLKKILRVYYGLQPIPQNRKCVGVEQDERYCEIIAKRLESGI